MCFYDGKYLKYYLYKVSYVLLYWLHLPYSFYLLRFNIDLYPLSPSGLVLQMSGVPLDGLVRVDFVRPRYRRGERLHCNAPLSDFHSFGNWVTSSSPTLITKSNINIIVSVMPQTMVWPLPWRGPDFQFASCFSREQRCESA